MKLKLLIIVTILALYSCGGGQQAASETPAEQEAIVLDSISTAVDEAKTELKTATDETVEEIDELLKDI